MVAADIPLGRNPDITAGHGVLSRIDLLDGTESHAGTTSLCGMAIAGRHDRDHEVSGRKDGGRVRYANARCVNSGKLVSQTNVAACCDIDATRASADDLVTRAR